MMGIGASDVIKNRCKTQNTCRLVSYPQCRTGFELPCGYENMLQIPIDKDFKEATKIYRPLDLLRWKITPYRIRAIPQRAIEQVIDRNINKVNMLTGCQLYWFY